MSAPSDASTTPTPDLDDLGRARWVRIWQAAFGAAVFRVISIAGTFVTVPLVLDELGDVRFGALVLVTQLATLLVFSDLGLGNGLVSSLAAALADDDRARARALVSSTWFLLVAVMLAAGAVFGAVVAFVDWSGLLGLHRLDGGEVTRAIVVFTVLFLVGIPASIAQKVHLARQEGWQANAWQTVGAVLTIVATVACVVTSATLPWFVAAAVGGSVVSAVLNCGWLFLRSPDLRPRLQDATRPVVRLILASGSLFLVLGAAGAVAYQTDALVISHLLGPDEVTTYNLALRLFLIPGLAVSFLLAPLWPAFGDAFARDDHAWARQTLRRAVLWGAIVNVPGGLFLVLAGQWLVDLWVGAGEVELPLLLLVSFGTWTALNAISGPMAMFLNGAQVVGFQVKCALAMAVSNIALSIVFTRWLGVSGPVLGSLVAQTACITVPSLFYLARRWDR
jgi:O-antigen/teichoic acid export membrane protein